MLKKIDKRTARKMFNNGKKIMFIPCKLNPCSIWNCGVWHQLSDGVTHDFDTFCNAVAFYNCNSETGKYLAYYING